MTRTPPLRALALLLATASTLGAQDDARAQLQYPLQQRVRVAAPALFTTPVIGRVATADSAHLALTVTRGGTALAIPYTSITALEASGGIDRGKGVRRGALVGLAAGAVFFATTYPEMREFDVFGLGFIAMSIVSFGIAPGAGALVGYVAAPEIWERRAVPAPDARVDSAYGIRFGPQEFVRLRVRDGTVSGPVVSQTTTVLSVQTDDATVRVPWRDVSEVKVRGGKNRVRGAVYGALILIGFGILGEQSAPTTSTSERIGAFTGAAVVGAYLGSRFLAPRGWTPLPIPGRSR